MQNNELFRITNTEEAVLVKKLLIKHTNNRELSMRNIVTIYKVQ